MNLRHFSGAEVHAALGYPALIEALREAFRNAGEPMPVRQAYDVSPAGAVAHLLTMPAWMRGEAVGVKLVTVFPRNADRGLGAVSSLYVLFDGQTGQPRALIDGEALTNRRTAAASALASGYLSRPDSRTLLIVGTGHLAPHLAAAHCAVRRIERVMVWGRNPQRARTLAGTLTDTLAAQGIHGMAVDDLDGAVPQADIISCATTASEPLIKGALLRAGTHLDLVGAFTPKMRESDDEAVSRARVFVDTYAGALAEAGDLLLCVAAGSWDASRVRADLHELTRGDKPGRESEAEITLFKSVGTAIEDLAAANLLVGKA